MMKHIENLHKEKYNCDNCETDFKSKADLTKHIAVQHPTRDWTLLVGDSHVKSVNSRHIERRLKGNRLRNPAASSPREGSAYTTSKNWPGAQFPDSNLAERVPKLLSERPYKNIIVLTPSNNIKNIENLEAEEQKKFAFKTAADTVTIVEKAIANSEYLEKAVIVELPPRADSKRLQELTEFTNFTLRSLVENSKLNKQITIASLDPIYEYSEYDIFGSPSARQNDGIHMRGKFGKKAYTESILTALMSAGLGFTTTSATSTSTIPTSNYYQVLSN